MLIRAMGLIMLLLAGAIAVACGGGDSKKTPTTTTQATVPAASPTTQTTGSSSGGASGSVPDDACALITLDQVKQLIPDATAGQPSKNSTANVRTSGCYWTSAGSTLSLKVEFSTLPPSAPRDAVKRSLQTELNDAGSNGKELSGIGDYAIVTSSVAVDSELKALVGGILLRIDLNGDGARAKLDDLAPLARAIAPKL